MDDELTSLGRAQAVSDGARGTQAELASMHALISIAESLELLAQQKAPQTTSIFTGEL